MSANKIINNQKFTNKQIVEWDRVCKMLKDSGHDLSKIRIAISNDYCDERYIFNEIKENERANKDIKEEIKMEQ